MSCITLPSSRESEQVSECSWPLADVGELISDLFDKSHATASRAYRRGKLHRTKLLIDPRLMRVTRCWVKGEVNWKVPSAVLWAGALCFLSTASVAYIERGWLTQQNVCHCYFKMLNTICYQRHICIV